MDALQEHRLNHDAYRRLKDTIDQTYKQGRFLAIAGGQIVADADSLDELRSLLTAMGRDPAGVFIVQAGNEYPETGLIFLLGRAL